ncbi:MAG: MFS transporter [Deltaproteobacteria bacterium]|jgi:EmrB/QacA subfamily drug resistance transporter
MQQNVSRGATLFAVGTASFLMPFMLSGVGVALPSIGRELSASAIQLSLVETAYMLSVSIFMLTMGRLGDIHGRRRIFHWGIAVFTLMGGLLSQAWSIQAIIAFRFLQGIGGAMIAATGMAIVVSVFPPEQRGKALGMIVACVYAGLSCGPFIGGAMITALGWRSLFYMCVPLGVSSFFLVSWKLRGEWADAKGEPFDWKGAVLYACAIVLLIFGAANLDHARWSWGLIFAGIAGLWMFVTMEAHTKYPVLNVGLFRNNRVFALSSLAALLNYAATFGVTFFFSLYLQFVKGMSPQQAGAVLIVQPVAQALFSPLCGHLSDRYSAAGVATGGMALCAAGLGISTAISASTSLTVLVSIFLLLGLGFALFSSPNMSVIMGSVAPRYLGVASGLVGSMRTLGMMTSMTIITVLLSVFMKGHSINFETQTDFLLTMRAGLACFCMLCGGGILCSIGRLRR